MANPVSSNENREFQSNLPPLQASRWRVILPCAVAIVVGVSLSILGFIAAASQEARQADLEFTTLASVHELALQEGIDDYLNDIQSLQALFESSSEPVSRDQFETFARNVLAGQPAIPSVSWTPRVNDNERAAHELATARQGIPDYHIRIVDADGNTVTAPVRPEYFPVQYRVDMETSPVSYILGVDQADDGVRGRAIETARDTGQLSVAESIDIRAGGPSRLGILVVTPVYRKGLPHETIADRRRNLAGFVRGIFEASTMLDAILDTTPAGLDFYLFGSDPGNGVIPLARSVGNTDAPLQSRAALEAGRHRTFSVMLGDHPLTLMVVPQSGEVPFADRLGALAVLLGGLFLTVSVAVYLLTSARHAQRLSSANAQLDAAARELAVQNMRFDVALNNMLMGLVMYGADERIVVCNKRFLTMYNLSPEIVKPGCTFVDLLQHIADRGHLELTGAEARLSILDGLKKGLVTDLQRTVDGRQISVSTVVMAQGGWVATFEDVTERRNAEARIAHMSLHDALTDLPNRRHFDKQVEERLSQAARGQSFAVLCLDLDHFKNVNDGLGHPAGDELLRQIAVRLKGCLREGDMVARLGGDEFAIVQGPISDPAETIATMSRLIEAVAEPFDLGGNRVIVGVSIGVAMSPSDGTTPEQLLKNADMALYRAKGDGRGIYRFFEADMDARMQLRLALELDLRQAVLKEQFEVYYQPLVNLNTDRIACFEALIRWHHPERGMISPDRFIPLAEETALIVPIGEWVLNQACAEAVTWPDDIMIAVNLSPVQFKKNLVQTVEKALKQSGLPARRLELEITESVLLLNNEATLATLHALKALGVHIAMDDFGTGYSSLSYLRSFPFDKIKIDQSFVRDLAGNEDSQAIVRAVAGLGTSLKMTTTGEGVETQAELEFLKAQGCTEAQGYFFSKPKPAGEIAAMLVRHAAVSPGRRLIGRA